MGMTIEEAENYLIALKHCETCEANDTNICKSCPHYRRGSSAKCYDAIDVGVDIMRKYQKIQEILKDDTYYEEYGNNAERFVVSAISEVVEDGSD